MKVHFDITIHGGPNGTFLETFDLPDDLSDEDFTNALDAHLMNYLDGYAEEEGIDETENPLDYSFGYSTDDGVEWSS